MPLSNFFGLQRNTKEELSKAATPLREIIAQLEALPQDQAAYLAAFAFILSRVANADSHICPRETTEMEKIVCQWGGIAPELALLVVQIAKSQNQLFGGTENYLVTRQFNKMATRAQKEQFLHCLFAIAGADDSISQVENQMVRQIADELQFSHQDFIAIRLQYKDKLAVLQRHANKGP